MNDLVMDAEKSVLGSILLDERVLEDVREIVTPGDFYSVAGEHLFLAVCALRDKGVPIDTLTVWNAVKDDPVVKRAGGAPMLHSLIANVPSASTATHYAGIVAKESTRRRVVAALTRGMQLATDGDPDAVIEIAANEVLAAARPDGGARWVGLGLDEWVAELDQPVEYNPTPWPALNAYIRGWTPGKFYVIGARPSVGKSLMGVQAALDLSRRGAVSLTSLEMGRDEITDRLVANLADVDLSSIQERRLTSGEKLRIDAALRELRTRRLAIDDRTQVGALDIGAHARAVARREPLYGVFVDYLQLMDGSGSQSREQDVREMSRQLKMLAQALHVPVVALSQLNRGSLQRDDRRPDMGDLRESGALEQDADVVILLHNPMITDPQTGEKEADRTRVTVTVDKHRSGRTGTFTLNVEGRYARLTNPALSVR